MNPTLWSIISKRLVLPVSPRHGNSRLAALECAWNQQKPLNGIIAYLTQKHGGNVHDRGAITITSTSAQNPSLPLSNLADLDTPNVFCTGNEPGQWVCWNFHHMSVRPTHYSVRPLTGPPSVSHLLSWIVEVSMEGVTWNEIDRQNEVERTSFGLRNVERRRGNCVLADSNGIRSFAVPDSPVCHFIRLTQTGKNRKGDDVLALRAFEVFGTLVQ
jgi:hypothetical protein